MELRDFGYEHYKVTNDGRIWSERSKKFITIYHTHDGYCFCTLYLHGIKKWIRVHRAVAIAFIPNPNNYDCVNHKDENKDNNNVENLEWCDAKYNINYGNRTAKAEETRQENIQNRTKLIGMYDKQTDELIQVFHKLFEVTEYLGKNKNFAGCISECLNNKRRSAYGYKWKYVNKNDVDENLIYNKAS
jgi:hypothetical protein